MSDNASNNKRIAKNTAVLYIRMIVMMIISFYTSRAMLNALGIEDYGINNVVTAVLDPIGIECEVDVGRVDEHIENALFAKLEELEVVMVVEELKASCRHFLACLVELVDSLAAECLVLHRVDRHHSKTDILCYYDAKIGLGSYNGMFEPITKQPTCLYYSFKAFGYLYALKNQVECNLSTTNVCALASSLNGNNAVLITNPSDNDETITLNVDSSYSVYVIDQDNLCVKTNLNPTNFTIKQNQVVLVRN